MIPRVFTRSLRAKITLSIIFPLMLILSAVAYVEHSRHRRAIMDDLSSMAAYSGQMIESSLRHAMLESDFDEVQGILNTIGENDDIQTVYLLDISGKIIFAPENHGVGTRLDNSHANCRPCHHQAPDNRPDSIIVTDSAGQQMFRSMHTIENAPECTGCHNPDQRLLGLLLTDISMASVEASLAADLRENLMWGAITILITIVTINLVLSELVLRRLRQFAPAIDRLRFGDVPDSILDNQQDEIGQLARAFNTMADRIATRNAENLTLSESLRKQSTQRSLLLNYLISAQEDERKRIARELHDELGQFLGGLALHTEAIGRLIAEAPERAITQVDYVHSLITETTEHMYDIILDLRPSVLDDIGLAAALRVYAERLLAQTDLRFELDSSELARRLPPDIETALYRIFQEALCNVVRHANASQVRVRLAKNTGSFEGEIVDDGRGFDLATISLDGTSPQGLGLLGMRERTLQCGGELAILSQPGSGTRITIRIPVGEDGGYG